MSDRAFNLKMLKKTAEVHLSDPFIRVRAEEITRRKRIARFSLTIEAASAAADALQITSEVSRVAVI